MEQKDHNPRRICNFIKAPDTVTVAVNASLENASAPNSIRFVPCLSQILQSIWEADPKEVPIWISKWDISNAFHWCNLRPSYVSKFDYVVPPFPSDASCLLFIYLVLPLVWFNSPDFFCSASDTVADNANAYALDLTSPFFI